MKSSCLPILSSRRWWLVPALLLALSACETSRLGTSPDEAAASTAEAEKAERAGDFVFAAREYLRAAAASTAPQKQAMQLRAADMLIKAGQPQQARALLLQVDVQALDPAFAARKRILEARLLSLEGAHDKAIRVLDEAARTRNIDPALLADIHAARAQTELALDNPVGAVRSLIAREALIVGKDAVADNQTWIWKILNALPRAQLDSARQLTGDALLGGWLDLALLAADNAGNEARLQKVMQEWRTQYPNHPAAESLIANVTRPAPEMIGRIERIALLLPLSSPHAVAAQAVRDGFVAAHAADPSPDRPAVTLYDVGADPAQIAALYRNAVDAGAQVVVGPLGRDATLSLVQSGKVSVPTLILSHLDDDTAGDTRYLFQFGLPPEQEARQVAERAYLDGHRQAAILYPENPWGERMMNAFLATWQRLGGITVANQPYRDTDTDHSEAIRQMANINQSLERAQRVANATRLRVNFDVGSARTRQDVDFVFLVADARRARLLKPQLNFYRMSRVPVYSTSHVYSGKPDPLHDTDLDGIVFGDMPWILQKDARMLQWREAMQRNWPGAFSDLDRLYALGVDSYLLLPQLNRIGADSGARFPGATSSLSVDRGGRLQRKLSWARFHKGIPRLIDGTIGPLPDETPRDGE